MKNKTEMLQLFKKLAVERYGLAPHTHYKAYYSIASCAETIASTGAHINVVQEALEEAIKESPKWFPKAQEILNKVSSIQARLKKQNQKVEDSTVVNNEQIEREKLKKYWVNTIGIKNVLDAEIKYRELCGLPSSVLFNNVLWADLNRQEQKAVDIINSYEKKPT